MSGRKFPQRVRLRKADEFREVYRRGKSWRGSRLRLFLLETGEARESRAGFSTSRLLRKAVFRNRARRLMREVFRLHRRELKPGVDLVLVWVGEVDGWGYREAEEEILRLWLTAGILRG